MYNIQKIIFFSKKVMNLKIMKDVALMGMGAGAVLAYQKYNKQVMPKVCPMDENTKREVYEAQNGNCKLCGKHFEIEAMEADHITPWIEGGRTVAENCQMLCRNCNRRKSSK